MSSTLTQSTEKQELADRLQAAWIAFRRLENLTESAKERQRLERLRNRLSDLMTEMEN